MLVLVVLLSLGRFLVMAIAGVQFLFVLITGGQQADLRQFSTSLCEWVNQSVRFLTFNSEHRPFPFSEWPVSDMEKSSGTQNSSESAVPATEGSSLVDGASFEEPAVSTVSDSDGEPPKASDNTST